MYVIVTRADVKWRKTPLQHVYGPYETRSKAQGELRKMFANGYNDGVQASVHKVLS